MESVNTTNYYASTQSEPYKTKNGPMNVSLTPLFMVIGVVGNLLILLVMPRSCVKTSATTRVYYCWIAFFDILTILSKDLVFSFLTTGIDFAFNDSPPEFSLIFSYSSICCKIVAFTYCFAEMTANNTVVALAIERIIIMFLPFQAKQLTGKRKANIGLTCLLTFAIVLSMAFLFSGQAVVVPSYSKVPICLSSDPNYRWASEDIVAVYMLIYVIPTFCGAILATIAVIKMKSILSKSRQLTRRSDDDIENKELKSTAVMIITVIINSVIFIPVGLCFCVLTAVQMLDPTNAALQLQITVVWLQMYPFAILPHSCQIFIYYSRIPGFSQGIKSLCKK